MTVDVADCLAGIDVLVKRMDGTMRDITASALDEVKVMAALYARAGSPGNSTNPPGDLKRSIDVEGPAGSHGLYVGRVGPTVVYGRQRELGGHIYPHRAKFLSFSVYGDHRYARHVYQPPRPYLKPGRASALPHIVTMANKKIAETIVGAG